MNIHRSESFLYSVLILLHALKSGFRNLALYTCEYKLQYSVVHKASKEAKEFELMSLISTANLATFRNLVVVKTCCSNKT